MTMIYVAPPHEEYDLTFALDHLRSFVIRDNELILYFEGDDTLWKNYFKIKEPKNILILKKRKA